MRQPVHFHKIPCDLYAQSSFRNRFSPVVFRNMLWGVVGSAGAFTAQGGCGTRAPPSHTTEGDRLCNPIWAARSDFIGTKGLWLKHFFQLKKKRSLKNNNNHFIFQMEKLSNKENIWLCRSPMLGIDRCLSLLTPASFYFPTVHWRKQRKNTRNLQPTACEVPSCTTGVFQLGLEFQNWCLFFTLMPSNFLSKLI